MLTKFIRASHKVGLLISLVILFAVGCVSEAPATIPATDPPAVIPTENPTQLPTEAPTNEPIAAPTETAEPAPVASNTPEQANTPMIEPTATPVPQPTVTEASSGVITDVDARGTGGGSPFDGTVDSSADLDNLVTTAWGVARLGLHRGHAPIESVLEAFLGIDHDEMHVLMDQGMNLDAVCQHLELNSEDLVDTLTASFNHFLEQGVENGVMEAEDVSIWTELIREQFSNRVYWDGS